MAAVKPASHTIAPLDSWLLARLRAGGPLNGEAARVGEGCRLIARRLAEAADDEDRDRAWNAYLDLLPAAEADALVEAVAAADPDGPPPDDAPEAWPALRLGEVPPVPHFPLEVLPDQARRLSLEVSAAIGCPVDFPAGQLLGIAAGAIGRARSLQLGSNHFARSAVYIAAIGLAGDGKSPSLGYVDKAVRDLEREFADAFRIAKDKYERECEERKKGEPKPRPPVPVRLGINDTTIEAAYRVMEGNRRGILLNDDELSSFLCGLNQYKSGGNDRSHVLKIWSGAAVTIDRVLNEYREPIRIPFPTLSIVGNIQPSVLPRMVIPGVDDGFLDRWLFVCPNVRPKLRSSERRPVSNAALDAWAAVVRRLWGLRLDSVDGQDCPKVVFFTGDGFAEFNRHFDAQVDEMNAGDFPKSLRGPWCKLEEYAGRLCLILAVLRHACDPDADQEELPRANAADARGAWALIRFFKENHRRVRAYLEGRGLGGAPEGTDIILRWLRHHPEVGSFSERDLTRNFERFRDDRASLEDSLAWLAERKAIRLRPAPDDAPAKKGRKSSRVWEIHPSLGETQKPQKPQNCGDDPYSAVSAVSAALPGGENHSGGADGDPVA